MGLGGMVRVRSCGMHHAYEGVCLCFYKINTRLFSKLKAGGHSGH